MKGDDRGDVVATRIFYLEGELDREIVVMIGRPRESPDSDDYCCSYKIVGAGNEDLMYSGGVDAVQALQLAMKMIGADLQALNRQLGGRLRWEGSDEGDFGFP